MTEERQRILNEYADASRALHDAVERLRDAKADGEGFIRALDETGTAHRACQRSRERLNKHLAQR